MKKHDKLKQILIQRKLRAIPEQPKQDLTKRMPTKAFPKV